MALAQPSFPRFYNIPSAASWKSLRPAYSQDTNLSSPRGTKVSRRHTVCFTVAEFMGIQQGQGLQQGEEVIESRTESLEPIQIDGDPPTTVLAPARRIVAVGDLHGDLAQARHALKIAGVLSADGNDFWTGGATVLVQLGDILDRGQDEIAIMSLLQSLSIQAEIKGGAVFQVNGNHETMNVDGDFRYVDPWAFREAEDFLEYCDEHGSNWETAFIEWIKVCEKWKARRKISSSGWLPWHLMKLIHLCTSLNVPCEGPTPACSMMHKGAMARSLLLRPGGLLACELARHGVVLKVNDWIFCHGSLLPHHVKYGIKRMNKEVAQWMRGENKKAGLLEEMPFIAARGFDSVVWSRLYSQEALDKDNESYQICMILTATLEAVSAKAMVVGHTPQIVGANCKCDHKIWRIDVGMSSGVLNAIPEVLEIIGDQARVISGWDTKCS